MSHYITMSSYLGHTNKVGLTQVVSTSSLFHRELQKQLINLLSSSSIRINLFYSHTVSASLTTELNKPTAALIAATTPAEHIHPRT
jgi:hypothetical protein